MDVNSGTEDFAITLVEQAWLRPEDEREAYLRSACGANTTLFEDAWEYMQWENRMRGFLQEPLQTMEAEKPPFHPGQILLNRFRVIREIAQGGMGIVWEAIDEKLDRRVALKSGKGGHGKQLPPEVRNAREISHPNICKIYEIHTAGETDFISMEFLEGQTLSERLHNGPIPEREARLIAGQLCSGLAEAHRSQLVHGDLKTNNILLTRDFGGVVRAVITDFGLARKFDASPALLGGTPAYMAPELWKGQKPSIQSDIYALGVILWELRSGRAPGELGLNSSTLKDGQELTGWRPPAGRGKWNRVVARCLNPDPMARFRSAEEVSRALGPSRAMQWWLAAASVAVVAGVSGMVTYNRAMAPTELVRLSLVSEGTGPAGDLLQNTANRLSRLRDSAHTRYRFVDSNRAATHTLKVGVQLNGDAISVHAILTDLNSGAALKDWTGDYRADQIQYAPLAITGLVTETIHLAAAEPLEMSPRAQAFYREGSSMLLDGKTSEALERFAHAAEADPRSPLPFAGLAEAQFTKYSQTLDGSWLDRSAESVRQAQLRNPDVAQIHQVEGLLDREAGREDDAIGELKRVLEIDPENDDAYRRLGLAYKHKDAKEEALAAFTKAIEKGPKNVKNYRELGIFYARSSANYPMAITQFLHALEIAPENSDILYQLGMAYKDSGQFESSEQALRASLHLKETSKYLETLGILLMCENKNEEAVSVVSRALKIETPRHTSWMNLGTAFLLLGRTQDATRAYKSALALAEKKLASTPKDAVVRSQVGYLCARLNETERAKNESIQALRFSPDDADVLWMVVLTDEALHSRDDTLAVLAKAPGNLLQSLSRWPEVAELSRDSRFITLLAMHKR